jgi:hypothetical protein
MKNYQTKLASISAGFLALMISVAPLSSFAKTAVNGKELGNLKKVEAKAEIGASANVTSNVSGNASVTASGSASTSSGKGNAFGHLIAPGWIKKNGTSTNNYSWLPFGIAKKLGLGTSTGSTTVDTTAPMISSVVSAVHTTDATITWMTDEKSNSMIFYGTSSASVGSSTVANVTKNSLVNAHSVSLSGLTASTTYYFKVGSKDASGNVSYSPVMSFTTNAVPVNKPDDL